ncbi:MAG: hypothetical protein HY077_17030 [Elusimicrobia bacterium]|nr:hypothetical protein [Elusimicrobiota bacterium]
MDEFKVGQLTKELVAIRLKKMADPCAAAADLVKGTLSAALKAMIPGDPGCAKVITDACQGGITGLLLADQNLPKGAALMLEAVAELAVEFDLDPATAMKAALLGISDVRRFARPDQVHEIQREIESHFMGAGEAFSDALAEHRRQSQVG